MHSLQRSIWCVGRYQSKTKRPQQQGVIQAGCGGGAGPLLLTANSSLRPQILTSPGHTTPSPSYSNGNQKDNSLLECYQAKSNHESTSNYSMKQLLNAEWPYHFLLCVQYNKQKPWSHTTYHFVSSLHIFDRKLYALLAVLVVTWNREGKKKPQTAFFTAVTPSIF